MVNDSDAASDIANDVMMKAYEQIMKGNYNMTATVNACYSLWF